MQRTDRQAASNRLEHFPVTLFSSVMGLAGLALAWRRAAKAWDVPAWPALAWFWVSLAVFVVVAGLYAAKWVRFPAAARAEVRHPVRMTFLPTITISLLLLATAGQDVVRPAAQVAWWVGALGQVVLTVAVLSAWVGRADILHHHVTPAWFIPIVGNIVTPLAAPAIGSVELGWFGFGVGIVFWVGLLPLLLQRVFLEPQQLPQKLLPTLAIFIAPPAVGGLAWQSLTGHVDDPVGRVLFTSAGMFTLLLLAQAVTLRRVPFALPYWAYSFPLAAMTTLTIAMAGARRMWGYDLLGAVLLAGTTLLVAVVAVLTVRAVVRKEICVPE